MSEKFTIEIEPDYLSTGAHVASRILEARPDNMTVAACGAILVTFADHIRYLAFKAADAPEGELSDYHKLMVHLDTYLPR